MNYKIIVISFSIVCMILSVSIFILYNELRETREDLVEKTLHEKWALEISKLKPEIREKLHNEINKNNNAI